jgi:NitT/TauT family transport system substrate-binding protein
MHCQSDFMFKSSREVSMTFLTAILLLALSAAGCKKESSTAASGPVKEVRLGYFANVTHAQAVLGVESGEFAQAVSPTPFSTKIFNAGPAMLEALFTNQIDIGYIGPGPALNGFAKSKGKLKIIAGSAGSGVLIVARKDSGITKLEDLASHKVATPQIGNTQDISAKHYVGKVLNKPTDKVLPVENAAQASQMARGDIDAAWAPEPWGSYLISQAGATLIAEERSLWKENDFAITVIVTTPEFLAAHPEVVEKILTVHANWTDRLRNNPKPHLPTLEAALFKLSNKRLPADVLSSAVSHTTFSDDPLPYTFEKFALWSYQQGLTNDMPDLSTLTDTTIMKKVRGAHPSAAVSPSTAPAK